ncbi:unnamed protein product, partial [Schistosoma curassoni]|uniref:Interleukin-1 n=1 Tax=Schistosoma curassoni TaxID=6186 RepID=A0A183JUN5_9TREM
GRTSFIHVSLEINVTSDPASTCSLTGLASINNNLPAFHNKLFRPATPQAQEKVPTEDSPAKYQFQSIRLQCRHQSKGLELCFDFKCCSSTKRKYDVLFQHIENKPDEKTFRSFEKLDNRNPGPGFVLLGTRQQGVHVILRELMFPGGFDLVSPSFTVKDVTTELSEP